MKTQKFELGVEYVLCGLCNAEAVGLISTTGTAAAFDEGPCALCNRKMEFGGGGYYTPTPQPESQLQKLVRDESLEEVLRYVAGIYAQQEGADKKHYDDATAILEQFAREVEWNH